MTATNLTTGNVWEQALYSHLVSHVDEEIEVLDAYQGAVAESHSEAFRYLVSLIVDEERRHHAMFSQLARTLQAETETRPEAFALPRLGHWGFERARILELTQMFLALERGDARRLEDLEYELEPVKDTTMWQLLVRLMEADTAKHISILEFIEHQVVRTWGTNEADWSGIEQATGKGPMTLPAATLRP